MHIYLSLFCTFKWTRNNVTNPFLLYFMTRYCTTSVKTRYWFKCLIYFSSSFVFFFIFYLFIYLLKIENEVTASRMNHIIQTRTKGEEQWETAKKKQRANCLQNCLFNCTRRHVANSNMEKYSLVRRARLSVYVKSASSNPMVQPATQAHRECEQNCLFCVWSRVLCTLGKGQIYRTAAWLFFV